MFYRAVVVAQLVSVPDVRGLNPVIGKFNLHSTVLRRRKDIKRGREFWKKNEIESERRQLNKLFGLILYFTLN